MKILYCGENLPRDVESSRKQNDIIVNLLKEGEVKCPDCKSGFSITWSETANNAKVLCPFCGIPIESFIEWKRDRRR